MWRIRIRTLTSYKYITDPDPEDPKKYGSYAPQRRCGGGKGGGGEDIGKARCTWELEAAFNRFKFLLAHLRFDDATIREEARLQDKFAPARWAWPFMRQPADNILNIFYLSLVRSWPSSTEHVLVQCSVGKASQWTRPFTPTRVGGLASGKSKSE